MGGKMATERTEEAVIEREKERRSTCRDKKKRVRVMQKKQ